MSGFTVLIPCDVGTTVYVALSGDFVTGVVDKIQLRPDRSVSVRVRYFCDPAGLVSNGRVGYFTAEDFGETVFLEIPKN